MDHDRKDIPGPAAGQVPPPPLFQGPPGWGGFPYGSPWGPPPGWGPPARKSFFGNHPVLVIAFLLVSALFLVLVVSSLVSGPAARSAASPLRFGGKRIGVVKVEGIIFDASEPIKQLHRWRDDDSIKAIVIRVDSPGGTVGASQEIYSEVKKLRGKKPIVVSMGSMAASGGYYVSCPADVIFANPGTITGSIGVVMEISNLQELLEWAKIDMQVIKSGRYKDIASPYRPLNEEERALLQTFVDIAHSQFVAAVSEGRDLPEAQVRELANGKIYTGETAKELGLVDELGNLYDAIDKAGELAGIEGRPDVAWPPRKRPEFLFGAMEEIFPGAAQVRHLYSPLRVMYVLEVQ